MHPLLIGVLTLMVLLLVALGVHLVLQHQRTTYDPQKLTTLPPFQRPEQPVSAFRALTDVDPIFQAWYQVLRQTRKEAWFSTYVWHVHTIPGSDIVTPHITVLGHALVELEESLEQPIKINILVNQARMLMTEEYVDRCWRETLGIWRRMGWTGQKVRVEGRAWTHWGLNNVHGKLLLVDDREAVMTSINIEQESAAGEKAWFESGTWVTDPGTTQQLKTFLQPYWSDARVLSSEPLEASYVLGGVSRSGQALDPTFLGQPLVTLDKVKVKTVTQGDTFNVYAQDYHQSPISVELVQMIRTAQKRIDIMSPTFNHPMVWAAIREVVEQQPHVHVRIMMGWQFNVTHPQTQKYLLGYPVNADFVADKLDHPQIEWRWYAQNGQRVHRHSGQMTHAKVVLVDEQLGKASSFNVDTWSSLNSMETAFFFESEKAVQQYRDELFEPQWAAAIPITRANVHDTL